MRGSALPKFAQSVVSNVRLALPAQHLTLKFSGLINLAQHHGFQVGGVELAKAFLNEATVGRMERLVFNELNLAQLKSKASRLEFITEGPLPPELLREPVKQPFFKQIIGYDLCKSCQLCIQVCPKDVYKDNGFGRPDDKNRRDEECTGDSQCGKCVTICPEKTIQIQFANPKLSKVIFILLENPYLEALKEAEAGREIYVANPLEVGKPLSLKGIINPENLIESNKILNDSNFHPVFEINGEAQHFVDSADPTNDLRTWSKENNRNPQLVINAVKLLYQYLPHIEELKEGKYSIDVLANRIIDEIILLGGTKKEISKTLLTEIISDAYIKEAFFGAKRRPIGGLLPPQTSPAWKTPYGDKVPEYKRIEKCLAAECALCVQSCPEGGGGEISAIKMLPRVPLGTISSLIRGLDVFVLRLDGTHDKIEDMEELTGTQPIEFKLNADYCKSCGTCMTICPHQVIEATARTFDLKELL